MKKTFNLKLFNSNYTTFFYFTKFILWTIDHIELIYKYITGNTHVKLMNWE